MDKQIIDTILLFMERVQLSGKEVVIFNDCISALLAEREKEQEVEEDK